MSDLLSLVPLLLARCLLTNIKEIKKLGVRRKKLMTIWMVGGFSEDSLYKVREILSFGWQSTEEISERTRLGILTTASILTSLKNKGEAELTHYSREAYWRFKGGEDVRFISPRCTYDWTTNGHGLASESTIAA